MPEDIDVSTLLSEGAPTDGAASPEETKADETGLEPQGAQGTNEQPPKQEPGWIKRRIDEGVSRRLTGELRAAEERINAQWAQRIAPLQERVFAQEAKELVASGEFKSQERALEYVRLKNGAPSVPDRKAEGQPQADGQQVSANAQRLAAQAVRVRELSGLDVMAHARENQDVMRKVISGEWDFTDVADAMRKAEQPQTSRTPSPARSSNGAAPGRTSVAGMTAKQFEALNKKLASGEVYDLRG